MFVYLCVCYQNVMSVTCINISEMEEGIDPNIWQMTDIVIDYTLEPFWALDLYPRSQERPAKLGRVPNFFFF